MSRGLKLCGQLRIHGYHDLLFLGSLFISNLNLFGDPNFEWFADHCSANIHNPLLRDLGHIFDVRKVPGHVWLAVDELEDAFETQILVHWHVQCFDHGIMDVRFLLGGDILKEINRNIF